MNKHTLSRLIKTVSIGARAALAREAHARAEWSRTCKALPKRKPKKVESLAKYDAAHELNRQALVSLQAAIAYRDTFREPFCTLLPMYDRVSTLAERIETLGIHADHHSLLNEKSGSIWMAFNMMESSFDEVAECKHGVIYQVLSYDLNNYSTNDKAARNVLLTHGGQIGGVTSWGMRDGALARSWRPFERADDEFVFEEDYLPL